MHQLHGRMVCLDPASRTTMVEVGFAARLVCQLTVVVVNNILVLLTLLIIDWL